MSSMIKNVRDNRAIQNPENEERLVHIEKKLYQEIQSVMTHKCKFFQSIRHIVTKGRASYMLRKSAKLDSKRKSQKEYDLVFEDLNKKLEEHKSEDEMN